MAESFHIDASQLRSFASDLRRETRAIQRNIRTELKDAGEVVADEAREIVGEYSTKVAESIRVRARSSGSVVIEAGGEGLPEAYLFERGNADSGPTAETWRHPVFGSLTTSWQEQPMHRYLGPALEKNRGEVADRISEVVSHAWAESEPR